MKNTFKKPVITYEPIEIPERVNIGEQRKDTFSTLSSILVISVVLGLMVTLIHIVGG